MSVPAAAGGRSPGRALDTPRWIGAALALLVVGALGGAVLASYPTSWLMVAGGLGLIAMLALAIVSYESAVGLGLVLLGVVAVEPAPPDGVFAVVIALAIVTGRFRIERAPALMVALVAFFLLLNVASMVDAVDVTRAAVFASITLYLAIFALWFTGWFDSWKKGRLVVMGYLIGALLSAALGTLSILTSYPGSDLFATVDGLRATALFKDPNVFGPFLVPPALILIEELLAPRLLHFGEGRSDVVLKLAALLILMLGLFFSYSRGALLNFGAAVAVMLLILAIRRGGGKRAATLLVVIAVGGAGIFGVAALTGQLDFFQERAQTQGYDRERFAAQRQGIAYGEENALGIGPGQFEVLQPVVSHNTYVRALSEQGFLGFVTIVTLLLSTLILAARNAVMGRDAYGIGSAALLGIWVGIAVESFFIDTLHWRHLWLVAGLIWVASTRPTHETDDRALA